MIAKAASRRWASWLFLGMLSLFPNLAAAQSGGSAAPLNPEFIAWQKAREEGGLQVQSSVQVNGVEHPLGYEPSPLDLSHIRGPLSLKSGRFAQDGADEPPASYDLRSSSDVSAIRDQGDFGTCWSFAAMASLESTQRKAGRGSFDFSEWHLAWYAYNNFNTTLVSFTKGTPGFGNDATFDLGGNNWKATAILARGTGAAAEAACPYQSAGYPLSSLPKGTEPVSAQLQEALYLGWAFAFDSTTAKTAVMNHGAVSISIYWNNSYYDATHDTYRYQGTSSNHAVNIVGWDDNYPAANFPASNRPTANGAWIVRNSWGSAWGDAGYFYLSYDSSVFNGVAYVSGADLYTQIYQYDPLGWVSSWGTGSSDTAWFSNVFTARATEDIDAVSFYAGQANSEYEVSVRTGVTGNPATGTIVPASLTSGTLDAAGYRKVTLASPVRVVAGTKFAVVVKLRTPGYNFPIPIEDLWPGYSSKATASAGQSYVSYDVDSPNWLDMTRENAKTNVCLKAFSTADHVTISANTPVTSGKTGLTASVAAETGCRYTWTIAGGTITAGMGTRAITYKAGAVGTLHLTCTVKNTAGTSLTGTKDIDVVTVPIAVVSSYSPVTTGTTGHSASVATQSAETSYAWTITGGTITSPANEPAITYTAGSVGVVTLKCVVNNGAGGVLTGTKTVSVIATPVTTLTAAATVTSGTKGLAASVPLKTGCFYEWTLVGDGTFTSVLNKNAATYTAGGVGSITLRCKVTNAAGTSSTGEKTVSVLAAPVATITADSPVLKSQAGLSAAVPDQPGNTYAWIITGGTIPGAKTNSAVTYTAGAVGTATLKCTVKNPAGTAITGTKAVSVVASNATIITATPVTTLATNLTARVPATAGATYLWTWSLGSGTITAGTGTNNITYTAGPVSTTKLNCSVNGGTAIPKTISVIAAPVAEISTTHSFVTAGKTGLTASVPAQTGCTYAWTVAGGKITAGATTRTATYMVTALAGGTVHLACTVKNAAGTALAASVELPVVAPPRASITAASPIVTLTPGLAASVPDQAGTFNWTVTRGTIILGQGTRTITYTAGLAGTATLKCAVTNLAGTLVTGSKTVTITAKPTATITATSPVTVSTENLPASVPAQPGCTYTWQLLAGTSSGGTIAPPGDTNAITYTSGSAGTARLSCTVSATVAGTSATATRSLTVVAAPVATITAPLATVTAKKTGLTATVPAQTGCTFKWTITGGTITAGATTRAITYTAGSGSSLQLTCTVKNAAGTTAADTALITVVAAPAATVTAQPLVTSGVGGWTASVPLVAGSAYDWSLSTGITNISDVHAAAITFTGGAVGTATLKCRVANGADVPATVTGTKVISVISAPVATITAPATLVVGTPGSATVPAQAASVYGWKISAGASIDSGNGTRSITFNAAEIGPVTLDCTVTNAAGTSVLGAKEVTASSRTITGKRIWTYLPFKATTGTLTPELHPATTSSPATYVHAVLSDGTIMPGNFNSSNGTFAIPDMPGGHYWLRRGNVDYIWTDQTAVDLSVTQGGRADVAPATTSPTPVVFNTTGLSPWSPGWDWLQFYDYNSTLWCEPDSEASSGAPPADWGTALNALTVDWSLYQNDGWHPLIDTAKGDAPQLVQMVDTPLGPISARIARKKYKPAPLTMVNGSSNYINGAFSNVPLTSSVTVNFNATEFASANSPRNPSSTTNGRTYLSFWDGPGLQTHGYSGEALQILGTDGRTTNLNAGTAAVPALPTGYQRMVRGNLKHSVDLLLPGTTIPYTYTGLLRSFSKTLPTASVPLRPMVGPVQTPRIGEASLFDNVTGVGLTPTLSWTAPATGSPQGYVFWIYEVSASGANTVILNVAKLVVGGSHTQFQMPAGVLAAGKTYFICTRAWMESGFNPETAPYHNRYLPYGFADSLSGLITP